MNLIEASEFVRFGPDALEAYSREKAVEIGLTIPNAYRPSLLENLTALQAHAAIVAARLKDASQETSWIAPL